MIGRGRSEEREEEGQSRKPRERGNWGGGRKGGGKRGGESQVGWAFYWQS